MPYWAWQQPYVVPELGSTPADTKTTFCRAFKTACSIVNAVNIREFGLRCLCSMSSPSKRETSGTRNAFGMRRSVEYGSNGKPRVKSRGVRRPFLKILSILKGCADLRRLAFEPNRYTTPEELRSMRIWRLPSILNCFSLFVCADMEAVTGAMPSLWTKSKVKAEIHINSGQCSNSHVSDLAAVPAQSLFCLISTRCMQNPTQLSWPLANLGPSW